MRFQNVIVPLAFLIVPGVMLAQDGHDRRADHDARVAAAAAAQHVVVQQPQHVRRDGEHARTEAGIVDPRFTRPEVLRRDRPSTTLSHGDMTRSLRADERANDVIAHGHKGRKHHKRHKKH
ncbi:MAG TPA: hypothetical protein VN706_12910 [Gemmatimonadaceae bacterium]|nr:hypothetical protein [Gemmatimonadaceae bacterium]